MPTKTIREIVTDSGGNTTIEFSDDSLQQYNVKDVVTSVTNPVTGRIALIAGGSDAFQITAKASGENFSGASGECIYTQSNEVIEESSLLTGTDFAPSGAIVGHKFVVSASASYIQGFAVRVKKSAGLSALSSLSITLYTDSAGAPSVAIAGGKIWAGEIATSYAEVSTVLQNVSTALTPGATYWAVITRSESGGTFTLDTGAGTGQTYQGASLGALSDIGATLYHKVFARSAYGSHSYAPQSHGAWHVSVNGVGVRGDSTNHYGGYFQSVGDYGLRGVSKYLAGVAGSSTNGNGVYGSTPSTTGYGVFGENTAGSGAYPGVYGVSKSGPGVMASTASTTARQSALRVLGGTTYGGLMVGPTYIGTGASAPAAGQWYQGDIFYNTAPASAGFVGWVCVTSGVPGLWKTFGLIS